MLQRCFGRPGDLGRDAAAPRAASRTCSSTCVEVHVALRACGSTPCGRSRRSASGAATRTRGPRAAASSPACRGDAPAVRRCRASPARCGVCLCSGNAAIVRMLCSRSASLMIRTRRSFAIATSILRIVAACCSSFESNWIRSSLVTPSTIDGDLGAELALDVVERDRGVLDRVVEEGGGHGDVVEPELGDDAGHRERVVDVALAGLAELLGVGTGRDLVGPRDGRGGRLRVAGPDRRPRAARPRPPARVAWRRQGRTRSTVATALSLSLPTVIHR